MVAIARGADLGCEERLMLSRHVVVRSFVEETVLMDVNSGSYFRIDREGGEMLRAVIETGSLAGGAASLARAGWGQVSELVGQGSALCGELVARGLLVRERRSA